MRSAKEKRFCFPLRIYTRINCDLRVSYLFKGVGGEIQLCCWHHKTSHFMDTKWKSRLRHILEIECVTYNFGYPAKRKLYVKKIIIIKREAHICSYGDFFWKKDTHPNAELFCVVKMSKPVGCPEITKSLYVSPSAWLLCVQVQKYAYPKSMCAVASFPVPPQPCRGGFLAPSLCCPNPRCTSRLWSVTSFCIRVTVFCSPRLAKKDRGWGGMLVRGLLAASTGERARECTEWKVCS